LPQRYYFCPQLAFYISSGVAGAHEFVALTAITLIACNLLSGAQAHMRKANGMAMSKMPGA
jgi:hypothetical protein